MPVRKTVFVMGAGSSKEADLPLGAELTTSIAAALDIRFDLVNRLERGDSTVVEALRLAVAAEDPPTRDINPHVHAAWQIRDAMPLASSIDNFLDTHPGDVKIELCGKLAIVTTILAAEKGSLLYVDRARPGTIDYGQLAGTWFNTFFQLLTEHSTASNLKERLSSIALVIFNYDRCVEHYLYHALQTYYSLSPQDAASLLKSLDIHHPYGTVGALPWCSSSPEAADFGATPDPRQLLNLAGRIKTFAEGIGSSEVTAIQENIARSSTLVFLGFAFHRMNRDLLIPDDDVTEKTGRDVFATAVGISTSDAEVISFDLVNRGGFHRRNVTVRPDLACGQLLREYRRSISLL